MENLYTQSFILPYLIPMLENAGANVLIPHECNYQTTKIIVGSDSHLDTRSVYMEKTTDRPWVRGAGRGFAHLRPLYTDFESSLKEGMLRTIETTKEGKGALPNEYPKFPGADNMQFMYPIISSRIAVMTSSTPSTMRAEHPGSESASRWAVIPGFT